MKRSVFQSILDDLNRGQRAVMCVSVDGQDYTRAFVPRDRLIVLGCGHVSQSLCEMADMLDFEMIVADDRPSFANSERFPKADRIICDSFVDAIRSLEIRDTDYICVVTRGHRWDVQCIEEILSGAVMPYYLGLISSHRRASGLKDHLADEGFDPDRITQIHSPIGLPIGAVTVPEIAVSICAELIQCRRRKATDRSENELIHTNTDLSMLRYLAASDEPCAMLLVLSSGGSTPVKSGSVMAVNLLGKGYGTVGGGCGEAAAITRARRVIGTGGSEVIDLDMTADVAAENGMVCGGSMRILIDDITD